MAITNADYGATINVLRGHLALGTTMSGEEMKTAIRLIQDAVSRMSTGTTGTSAVIAVLTPLNAAACAANSGATAAAVIAQAVIDLTAASASVPTYVVSLLADG